MIGAYAVHELLGSGAFGSVYKVSEHYSMLIKKHLCLWLIDCPGYVNVVLRRTVVD